MNLFNLINTNTPISQNTTADRLYLKCDGCVSSEMHKWLQLPATPTDDPLATVYPSNHYKKSHVYAVTRINPIYVDDELHHHHGTWNNKNSSSGYDSHPHSDHSSSLDKNSPPGTKCLRSPPPSPTGKLSGGQAGASWLSPIEEGVVDVRLFIPRPVWPGHDDDGDDDAHFPYADHGRIPRAKCCRPYNRCRCLSNGIGCSSGSGTSSTSSGGGGTGSSGSVGSVGGNNGLRVAAICSYSGYSSAYGGTVSTSTTTSGGGGSGGGATCSCSDDANPSSSGIGSVSSSNQSPLILQPPRFGNGDAGNGNNKALANCAWNSAVDLRLNQKTDNLHNDCDAMLRGLQFTLDAQQAEKLMQKIKVGKKHRCWCRLVTTFIGLIMFLVSVVTVTLVITKGKRMFGSI